MADELIDIVDENLVPVGTALKSEAHASGLWHFSIHCWIVRGDGPGYVLFQKRSHSKELFPDMLDITAAGHYQAGEGAADGTREILEELGVDIPYDDLIPLGIKVDLGKTDTILNREFCRTFLLRRDAEPAAYVPDPEEVVGLVQVPIDEGLDLMSGRAPFAHADGIVWDEEAKSWTTWERDISVEDLIPRIDSYYYKVFIMARLLLQGWTHLAI
jgi:isopentenyldiphosphate isomerase